MGQLELDAHSGRARPPSGSRSRGRPRACGGSRGAPRPRSLRSRWSRARAGELGHQERGESPPAQGVRDLERDLGAIVVDGSKPHERRSEAGSPMVATTLAAAPLRHARGPVSGESEVRRGGEEAQAARLERHRLQEARARLGVVRRRDARGRSSRLGGRRRWAGPHGRRLPWSSAAAACATAAPRGMTITGQGASA